MALNDDAVITAATGYIYTAPEGTAAPTPAQISAFDPAVGFPNWDDAGHTSRDDLPEFGFEGGDSETKGTWRNAALRTVTTEVATDYVTFKLQQWDGGSLSFYYGTANGSTTPGIFRVKKPSTGAIRKALLIVIVDGDVNLGFYAPKTDIKRDDAIELATDEFGSLPIRSTFLEYIHPTDGQILFDWISEDTGINEPDPGA